MRMLDNVIDINYYAVNKARNSNAKHRPVGMGIRLSDPPPFYQTFVDGLP